MSSSIANKLSRNPHLADNEVQFLLTEMQSFRDDVSLAAENDVYIPFADEVRLRDESHTVRGHLTGRTPAAENRVRECTRTATTMLRIPTKESKSYPLIHATFGNPLSFVKANDSRFGGGSIFDGTNYINIADHARLKPTNAVSIAGWFYLKKIGELQEMFKMQDSDPAYEMRVKSDNDLRFRNKVGGVSYDIDVAEANWSVDVWTHFVMTWKGTPENRMRLYINSVKQGSDVTTSGALTYSGADGLGIGAQPGGNSIIANGSKMAWLSFLNTEVDQTWVTNNFNGILDTDGLNEITTIPFIGDERPMPETSFGIAV